MHARHIISRFFSISSRSDQLIVSSSFIDRQNTWSWWLVRRCVKFMTNATVVKTYRDLRWNRRRRRRWLLHVYATRKFTFWIVTKELLRHEICEDIAFVLYDESAFSSANLWACMRFSSVVDKQKKIEIEISNWSSWSSHKTWAMILAIRQ